MFLSTMTMEAIAKGKATYHLAKADSERRVYLIARCESGVVPDLAGGAMLNVSESRKRRSF